MSLEGLLKLEKRLEECKQYVRYFAEHGQMDDAQELRRLIDQAIQVFDLPEACASRLSRIEDFILLNLP